MEVKAWALTVKVVSKRRAPWRKRRSYLGRFVFCLELLSEEETFFEEAPKREEKFLPR